MSFSVRSSEGGGEVEAYATEQPSRLRAVRREYQMMPTIEKIVRHCKASIVVHSEELDALLPSIASGRGARSGETDAVGGQASTRTRARAARFCLLLRPTMSSLRNSLHRKNHKERSQLAHRARFGFLEKHKDYVLRARDYHSKQERLQRLRQKAADRNKDEFYFAMNRQKTKVCFRPTLPLP
jgi:hypothetical protein